MKKKKVANQYHYGYSKNIHYEIDIGEKGQKKFEYAMTITILILGLFMVVIGPSMLKVMGFLLTIFGIYALITISKKGKKKDDNDKHIK
ncbi:MAG: hypothetical protein IJ220_08875 [Clostridia bacterium]|nr:hypothetical protein [Clostridia bacterium]